MSQLVACTLFAEFLQTATMPVGSWRPAVYPESLSKDVELNALKSHPLFVSLGAASQAEWNSQCGKDCAACGMPDGLGASSCLQCSNGFGFYGVREGNYPDRTCLPCAEHCDRCDGFLGGCASHGCRGSSNLGLQLKVRLWSDSSAAEDGWRAGSPGCGTCGPNCAHCGEQNTCYANGCSPGYGPSMPYNDPCAGPCGDRSRCWNSGCDILDVLPQPPKTTCEPCASGCKSCTLTGAGSCDPEGCNQRGFDYHKASGQCIQCGEDCNICREGGPGKCDDGGCRVGLVANKMGWCVPCSDRCHKCDKAGGLRCDIGQCHEGYGHDADSGGCMRCAENCKKCQVSGSGFCDTDGCSHGFVYDLKAEKCKASDESSNGSDGGSSFESQSVLIFLCVFFLGMSILCGLLRKTSARLTTLLSQTPDRPVLHSSPVAPCPGVVHGYDWEERRLL